METGTGIDYFRSLSLFELLKTWQDFVELMNDINNNIRRQAKKKK